MKMNIIKHFDLPLYSERLKNGLIVNLVPKMNVSNVYATLSAFYGSFNNDFKPIDSEKYYHTPLGVAHFLEHKVFEQESGEDPFSFYTKNGADANASTSYQKTTYLFSGTGYLKENLNYLLDFVQQPYFTEENVTKEKGIIEQEIKMYDDVPYWKLIERTLYNAFHVHPLKYPIAGTVESIRSITVEDLYTCYNTFYHPSNMFLTIVGNFDPKEMMTEIRNNQNKKKYKPMQKVELASYDEDDTVIKDYDIIKASVEIPKVTLSYKFNVQDYDINQLKYYLNTFFELKLGITSKLNEALKDNSLITGSIDIDIISTDRHILIVLLFESKDYQKVIEMIQKELEDKQVLEKDLNRKKKVMKSACVYRSDNIYSIASKINNNLINYHEVVLDEYSLIDALNVNEFNEILTTLSFENKTINVLKKD